MCDCGAAAGEGTGASESSGTVDEATSIDTSCVGHAKVCVFDDVTRVCVGVWVCEEEEESSGGV